MLTVPMFQARLASLGIIVSDQTIRNWITQGLVEAIELPGKHNRKFRIPESEIVKIIKGNGNTKSE